MCTEVDIDDMGYVLPEKTEQIALIDADTVVFASCTVFAGIDDLLPRDMYTDIEWAKIEKEPGFDEKNHCVRFIDYEEAYKHSLDKINSIMERTGCSNFELHFTRGRKSFPYTMVDANYKGNRDDNAEPPPFGLAGVKDMFVERFPDTAFNNYEWEADHIVVCKARDSALLLEAEEKENKNVFFLSARDRGDKHGQNLDTDTRGLLPKYRKYYQTKIYKQWDNMLGRINTGEYKENGIGVYESWYNPNIYIEWALNNGYYEGCSIDRIDYYGHYIPSNIQFISVRENTSKQNLLDNPKEAKIDWKDILFYRENRHKISTRQLSIKLNIGSSRLAFRGDYKTEKSFLCSIFSAGTKFKLDGIFYIVSKDKKAVMYRDYIMASVDKDVYLALPTSKYLKIFNYYSSTKWNIDMKWVTNTEDDALRRYYIQTLTGDTGDNVIGLHGIGPVKAKKALAKCTDEICMWKEVVKMYESHGRDIVDAICNMRLVDMRQLELNDEGQYEVKLWVPKV